MVLGQVIEVCIRVRWKKLAKKPKKALLISTEELNHLCKLAIEECPSRGKVFADYRETFSLTGGREKETLTIEWDKHIHWKLGRFEFPGGKRGGIPGSGGTAVYRFLSQTGKALEGHV
jgi:hypothetical protein